jgi:hypothetical protein
LKPLHGFKKKGQALGEVIVNRLETIIDDEVTLDQAAFRKDRGCTEQTLALTTYIENGFQKGLKSFACFMDMTAAYDTTVWIDRLISKLIDITPCKRIIELFRNIYRNRFFNVHLGNNKTRCRKLNNGLIQGSVLPPVLFNFYTNDNLNIRCKRFMFADDWALIIQCKTFEEAQLILEEDLKTTDKYFKFCNLLLNLSTTEVCAFHLNNREAERKLGINFDGHILKHSFHLKYLGMTLALIIKNK